MRAVDTVPCDVRQLDVETDGTARRSSTAHDALLPSQLAPRWSHLDGTQCLWFAVMDDAIDSVLTRGRADYLPPPTQRQLDDDRAWILSDRYQVASFRWCCAVLGLEANAIRSALRREGVLAAPERAA